jgi:hypothetical protein
MKKINLFFVGMAAVLALVLVLAGCEQPSSGGGDGGGLPGDPSNDDGIAKLPAFEGAVVASESEASTLASGSMAAITSAIAEAMSYPDSNSRAVYASGTYSYNGVTVQYNASTGGSYPDYPYTMDVTEKVTINGTYIGYTIKGTGLDIQYTQSHQSASEYTMKYTYKAAYTVSYNGKGMKLEYTGTMDMSVNGSTSYNYNLHYKVYDNSNKLLFNYDYTVSQ